MLGDPDDGIARTARRTAARESFARGSAA